MQDASLVHPAVDGSSGLLAGALQVGQESASPWWINSVSRRMGTQLLGGEIHNRPRHKERADIVESLDRAFSLSQGELSHSVGSGHDAKGAHGCQGETLTGLSDSQIVGQ
jgi:hypothetical protein